MKTRLLIVLFLSLFLFDASAQTNNNKMILGNVYNILSNAPIVNYKVYCTDSLTYSDSTSTGINGQFLFPIGNVQNPNLKFYVYTFDCNHQKYYSVVESIDTVSTYVYFTICNYYTPILQASFISDSINYMAYHFNNTSQGNPSSTTWDFGDGTNSNAYSPTHTYSYPGQHLVHLTISDPIGQVSHSFAWLNVKPSGACNVSFTYDTMTFDSIKFNNASSCTYPYSKYSFLWNFGDGTTDTNQNPIHKFALYPQNNGYNICLMMTSVDTILNHNDTICIDSYCYFININAPVYCKNQFSFTNVNHSYQFKGGIDSFYPSIYKWDFGDNTFATSDTVSHTYTQPPSGITINKVCLSTITTFPNAAMCYDTTCKKVYINGLDPVIYGFVKADAKNADEGFVVLYGLNNPSGAFITLDTTDITENGFYTFPKQTVVYPSYLLKAILKPSSIFYNSYLPTYYDSIARWVNSPAVYPTTDGFNYEINLLSYNNIGLTGVGNISGNVSLFINATTTTNLEGIEVVLFDMNNHPLDLKFTRFDGTYLFNNLNYGTYKIHVEIPGKIAQDIIIILSPGDPQVTNVNFVVKDKFITSVENNSTNKIMVGDVYPNPAKGKASINFNFAKATTIKLVLLNNIGQVCFTDNVKVNNGPQHYSINTQHLSAGFYTIQIISADETKFVKKFVVSP